jgi:hypothetical protein
MYLVLALNQQYAVVASWAKERPIQYFAHRADAQARADHMNAEKAKDDAYADALEEQLSRQQGW